MKSYCLKYRFSVAHPRIIVKKKKEWAAHPLSGTEKLSGLPPRQNQ